MITPARVDLVAQRWTPFVDVTVFEDFDFSAATFAMHIRVLPDAAGDPPVSLANAASNAQGISVSVATVEGQTLSSVQIRINETTIEGLLLNAAGAGKDVTLYYDLHITGGGLEKTRMMEGKFIIKPGVTQNG
ncbi:hypothetical protein [Brevundimonas viscosa]|uniref:Uncharacterized protein n=1 Tax=Brevundimonas viscosa TaxID=871741 RepID=A0A1I6PPZ6_9CAUL|nr:hypothetical protein [Brevundimonas viscosa]SFS42138.1 hypothetical protein SAMN05192570_1158 [Brevundimonas viscosa]